MENGGGLNDKRITAEEVISKLKDDGDFDRLRLKIVRKLKDNEELRNSIMSTVKQSAAINRPGAENMKPRQLSDAIHEEVGDKVMRQISDGVWEIIRSTDDMKAEIRETVQSVYKKLSNPKGNEDIESSSCVDVMSSQKGLDNTASVSAPASEAEDMLSDSAPKEPPGFSLHDLHHNKHGELASKEQQFPKPLGGKPTEGQKEDRHCKDNVLEPDSLDRSPPPGFSAILKHKQPCDDSDEDPDVPPGFG